MGNYSARKSLWFTVYNIYFSDIFTFVIIRIQWSGYFERSLEQRKFYSVAHCKYFIGVFVECAGGFALGLSSWDFRSNLWNIENRTLIATFYGDLKIRA